MELDMHQRNGITEKLASRYRAANKAEKSRLLDEYTEITGYNRKYAIHLLTHWGKVQRVRIDGELVRLKAGRSEKTQERRGRKRVYDEEVFEALKRLWAIFDMVCGKLLAPAMRTHLARPEFLEELGLPDEVREKLQRISPATIDRLLAGERKKLAVKGSAHTTRAREAILSRIPVRTFADHPTKPGYLQADLVGHDGGDASGDFCYTLNSTDPVTGWCEPRALLNKAAKWTTQALRWVRFRCPVPIRGWHTDSGKEFINAHMERYCSGKQIEFTRCRFGKKNDNCHVEQKNDALIRRKVGYLRYEGEKECALLNELYDSLRLLSNFFIPQQKLIAKERIGSKVRKRYDEPRTPYERVMEHTEVSKTVKAHLRKQMQQLDPLDLQRRINEVHTRLINTAKKRSETNNNDTSHIKTAG